MEMSYSIMPSREDYVDQYVEAIYVPHSTSMSNADGLASSLPSEPSSPVSEPGAHIEDHAGDLALKEHMGKYPLYFDSTIAEHERVPWARSNLPQELSAYDSKRLKFEEDRRKWEAEMEELRAKKLLEVRKEIVRLWIRRQEASWVESRAAWQAEKQALEESMRVELMQLRDADKPTVFPAPQNYRASQSWGVQGGRWS